MLHDPWRSKKCFADHFWSKNPILQKPEEKKLEPVNEFVAQKLPDNVRDMALSADGKRLAIAYQGGISRVYALA